LAITAFSVNRFLQAIAAPATLTSLRQVAGLFHRPQGGFFCRDFFAFDEEYYAAILA
jgi:hypothetical protein